MALDAPDPADDLTVILLRLRCLPSLPRSSLPRSSLPLESS
jgi:hypothetical protein